MKTQFKIILVAFIMGVVFLIVDAEVDHYIFDNGSTLMDKIIGSDNQEILMRILVFVCFIISGIIISFITKKTEHAEQKVIEAYNELQLIYNKATDGMCLIDKDFNLLRANDTMVSKFGLNEEDKVGKKCYNVLSESRCKTADCPLMRIIRGEEAQEHEEQFQVNGSEITCLMNVTPFHDAQGEFVGVLKDYRDISARVKAEKEVQHRLEMEEIIASISAYFINSEPKDIGTGIQEALQKTGEFSKADRSYIFAFHDNGSIMENTYEWCSEGIESQIDSLNNIPSDSFPWWVKKLNNFDSIHVPRISDLPPEAHAEKELLVSQGVKSLFVIPLITRGKLTGFLGYDAVKFEKVWTDEDAMLLILMGETIVNALERKKTEEILRESEMKYRTLYDSMSEGVALHEIIYGDEGDNYRILDVNHAFETLTGLPKELAVGKTATDLYNMDEPPYIDIYSQVVETGKAMSFETDFDPMGKTFSISVFSPGKGEFATVFEDISERKIAEAKLNLLVTELESKNTELEDFAYVVSHDLKAPLRAIGTLSEWLSIDYADKLGDDGKEQLALLMSRIKRMHGLIDGVLKYSRLGRISEEKEVIELREAVVESIEMIAPPENIRIDISSDMPSLFAEKTRIKQVFENLMSNAVKYMDKPKGIITIDCVADKSDYIFRVTDNGPGIEEKYHEKIFKMFQTLTPRDQFESTGIGLTLVKKIITVYGGEIKVKSTPGEGSTFAFTLPEAVINKEVYV